VNEPWMIEEQRYVLPSLLLCLACSPHLLGGVAWMHDVVVAAVAVVVCIIGSSLDIALGHVQPSYAWHAHLE